MNQQFQELKNIPNKNCAPLRYVFENELVIDKGLWLEFGVYSGKTINKISAYTKRTVYGFDSFEGLPETWQRSDGGFEKGTFNTSGIIPVVNENVILIKGLFEATLPSFIKEHNQAVYFIHVDCDIYASTKTLFHFLHDKIANGCVIVFDELINYPDFEQHEWKAWWEFVVKYNVKFQWLCMNGEIQTEFIVDRGPEDQQVAVKIIDNPAWNL